jgi:hypothetical protein
MLHLIMITALAPIAAYCTDAQIDDLIFKLYGITDEERRVVEGGE